MLVSEADEPNPDSLLTDTEIGGSDKVESWSVCVDWVTRVTCCLDFDDFLQKKRMNTIKRPELLPPLAIVGVSLLCLLGWQLPYIFIAQSSAVAVQSETLNRVLNDACSTSLLKLDAVHNVRSDINRARRPVVQIGKSVCRHALRIA